MSAEKKKHKQQEPSEANPNETPRDPANADCEQVETPPAPENGTAETGNGDMDSVAKTLATDLDRLRNELEEAQNRALRSSADLENYRKRANRQIEEERRYANIDLIRDLLPVWDNMGRAVEAAEKADQNDPLIEGFKMVCQQLESVLERHHCVKIEAIHQPFDPHLHEAISQMPSEQHPAGKVLHVTQVGFQLHDRVVRPCQVVVSTGSPEEKTQPAEPAADEADEDQL